MVAILYFANYCKLHKANRYPVSIFLKVKVFTNKIHTRAHTKLLLTPKQGYGHWLLDY